MPTPVPAGRVLTALGLAAILFGVAIRCAPDLSHGLWEDEVIAATHAVQPFPSILVNIVRNDIHPPLYFLQLHLWSLGGHGDGWLIANSVFWGVASLLSMWAANRRDGEAAALAAAAFLAVLPAGLWMSQELRPYAWICTALIWAFAFARRAFGGDRTRPQDVAALFAACLVVVYSHAVGFLAPFFLGVYSAILLRRRPPTVRDALVWGGCYGLLGVAALPVLASNMLHDANLPGLLTPWSAVASLSEAMTISGRGGAVLGAGLAIFLLVAVCGLLSPRTRTVTACLVVLPMLCAVGLGLLYKPVFKANIFGTVMAPFVALVLGRLCTDLPGRWRSAVTAAALAGSAAVSVPLWHGHHTASGYQDAAAAIRAASLPGDVVYAPQPSMFWGMAWYLGGPEWGSPIAIANPPSPAWQAVYRRLGPRLVSLLGLQPRGQSVPAPGGLLLLIGNDSGAQAAKGRRVWLVTNQRVDLPPGFPPGAFGALHATGQQNIAALTVTLYQ